MIHHMQAIARNFATGEYMGALVRPMGQTMEMLEPEKPKAVKAIRDAFYKAGVEAVTLGRISDELQDAVAAPLISFEEFVQRSNALFKDLIAQNQA